MNEQPPEESLRKGRERDQFYAYAGLCESMMRFIRQGCGIQSFWLYDNGVKLFCSERYFSAFKTFYCPGYFAPAANKNRRP